MYDFQARIPFDHATQLIANFRAGDFNFDGDNLKLCGAILGECGALLDGGLSFTMADVKDVETPKTIYECIQQIENAKASAEIEVKAIGSVSLSTVLLMIQLIKQLIELLTK